MLESRLGAAFSNISVLIGGVGTALVFAAGAMEVLRGRMTPGGVVATAALAAMIFGPVARLADLAYVFEQTAASVDRLGEILDLEPDVREPAPGAERVLPGAGGRAVGAVTFDRVGFGYRSGQPVVWDIRLDVEPGMKVALVGPTGCGKSTLINLLMRFYDPTWGEVRLDGVPIRDLPTRVLRGADRRGAAGAGGLPDEPGGQYPLRSPRGGRRPRRGRRPRGAGARFRPRPARGLCHDRRRGRIQAQPGRAAAAGDRAGLCKEPALVVLDEATSSLDTPSEALIQSALANLLSGRTAFIIAHRLSTITDADRIVVMDGGLIVQVGTHAELLAEPDGLYRRLCARQFGEPGLGDPPVVIPTLRTDPVAFTGPHRRADPASPRGAVRSGG